jgi:hypothetical protein
LPRATTASAYDGVAYFAATHSEGDSCTQSNSISYNALTPTAPTDVEMFEAIAEGIAQIVGQKDDDREPLNEAARRFW